MFAVRELVIGVFLALAAATAAQPGPPPRGGGPRRDGGGQGPGFGQGQAPEPQPSPPPFVPPPPRLPAARADETSRPPRWVAPAPVPAPAEPSAPEPAPVTAGAPAAPKPAENAAPSSLLPLAAVIAAAAGLLFALWKLLTKLNEPPAPTAPAPARPATAPVASPPPAIPAPATRTVAAPATGPNGGLLIGGNYETRRELGTGGMGVVFEAHDLQLDRRVALKKMRPEIGRSPRGRDRFLAEARMVAKLQHPNIVGIHAIIEDGGDLYLVLEYVDGETLDERLLRDKFLQPADALKVLSGVAAAVDYAHEERVIHRDLKPANIMLDKSGRPKVMDFGIAHQAKITISQLTMAEAYGTLAYMPPEQELGQAVRESDIYAFAAVTYETLTGGLPFPGPNFHLQKASMTFLRPSQADPTLPRAVDEVFERAFQPEPKKRHPTTSEFVASLGGALERRR